ncbi:hypothetical protein HanXRQr2_Chr02g0046691 [Helianthus annuus]|uniref:Uncharacterized protein n=1 Tax=Helianthus annuus TaxID=4232 RepID=A0A9K3JLK7_HELAN|nr:hypothetical protein HanXRQr2_Chr02g0046691 [Helianthus annuus]KAJ0950273.1 hypothetical protein HanPSC8_Chr02g0046301 [Helianthus annuus]
MFCFDFSTSQTFADVGCYMSLHAGPPDVRSNVTYVPLPLQVPVSCQRAGPKCVQLRSKRRLPFVLVVVSSHVKLQLEHSLVSTLLTERLVSGKGDWTES